jgi:quinol monooxygenase YgiN
MYASVRRYDGVTDVREAIRRVNEGFVQIVSEIPGFVAYYWVDADGGVMISVSVFQDRASAEESNAKAAGYVREKMASLLPNPPQITAGEVVAHTAK